MNNAYFILIGIALTVLLNTLKESWFANRSKKQDVSYLASRVCVILDRFILECATVVENCETDMVYYKKESKEIVFDTPTPNFSLDGLDINWKCINPHLTYEILSIRSTLDRIVKFAESDFFEDGEPCIAAVIEERAFRMSQIGKQAYEASERLKSCGNLTKLSLEKDWAIQVLKAYPNSPWTDRFYSRKQS